MNNEQQTGVEIVHDAAALCDVPWWKRWLLVMVGRAHFVDERFRVVVARAPALRSWSDAEVNVARQVKKLRAMLPVGTLSETTGRYSDEPPHYSYSFGPKGHGGDFSCRARAMWRAVGENIERVLWLDTHFYRDERHFDVRVGRTIRTMPAGTMDLSALAGWSSDTQAQHPELRWDKDTPFSFIRARGIGSTPSAHVPLQLMSAAYHRQHVRREGQEDENEPMLRWGVTTGLASGRSLDDAVLSGMCEVIERDAFMITYLNRLSPPRLNFAALSDTFPALREVLASFRRYALDLHLVVLPTDFRVHAVLAVVIDNSGIGPRITVGASVKFDIAEAVLSAAVETLLVRCHLRRISFGTYTHKQKHMGRTSRLVLWAQKESAHDLSFLLDGPLVAPPIHPAPAGTRQKLAMLHEDMKNNGVDGYYVEISRGTTSRIGLPCVFVLMPQMQPLHLDERIPYFGGGRLATVPAACGYTPCTKYNTMPHPFP